MLMGALKVGGGGDKYKAIEGSLSVTANVPSTVPIDGLTKIHCVEWTYKADPANYYGMAVNMPSLFSEYNRGSYGHQTGLGVTGISGNTFTFLWNGSDNFDYIVFGE